jgi:Icc-related predicted phosphoesterase
MRVLAAADVHGKWPVYQWLVTVAREQRVQAMILAGDLLGCPDGFDSPEQAQQHEAKILVQFLEGARLPVFYIMGNDDLVELNSHSNRVQSLHGRRVRAGHFAFVGYQYSLPFMGGTFEKPEADIETDLRDLTELLGAETVVVTHSPVFGVLDPGFGEAQIGSRALAEFLAKRPFLVHIHGHSHAGFGREGRHLNVASAGRERAMVIDLETLRHEFVGLECPSFET